MSAGRHARPIHAQEAVEQEPAPTIYFRAGRWEEVVPDAAPVLPVDGRAV